MSEEKEMLTKLKSYDLVERARKRLPDPNNWNMPEFEVSMAYKPDNNPLEVKYFVITFRKDVVVAQGNVTRSWEYKSARELKVVSSYDV